MDCMAKACEKAMDDCHDSDFKDEKACGMAHACYEMVVDAMGYDEMPCEDVCEYCEDEESCEDCYNCWDDECEHQEEKCIDSDGEDCAGHAVCEKAAEEMEEDEEMGDEEMGEGSGSKSAQGSERFLAKLH